MLLYITLLISKLCYCKSLTSLEIFDVFDDPNIEVEFPEPKSSGNLFDVGNSTVTHRNITGKTSINNISIDNFGNTTSANERNNTKGIINKFVIFNNNDEIKKQSNDTYKGSINKSEDANIRPNKTNELSKNETKHMDGVSNGNKLNNSTLDVTDGTFNKSGTLPSFSIPPASVMCPEEESPSNIGAYEVPTQRDIVIHIRNHLISMYHGFHTKAMNFLKDVKEATHASWSRKIFCSGPTELMLYRRCVRWVGEMSVLTTKSLVTALETARHNIATFMQGKICSISALKVDPINLIRILAAEKVSLEFALPDFLRQLNACARHCPRSRITLPQEYLNTYHLTDKDFVVRHLLTQNNYNQQLTQQYKV